MSRIGVNRKLKILVSAHVFAPSVGGVQDLALLLAGGFVALGHEVRLVTETPGEDRDVYPFAVVRQPTPGGLLRLVRWCDLYYHCNVSLRSAWPLLFFSRPWVVTHCTWICAPDGTVRWSDRIKRAVLRSASCVSVSQAIADHLSAPSVVIPPSYPDGIFYLRPEIRRESEVIFVGRLVSDKGVDLLLEAMVRLREMEITPTLTLVGSGPEEAALKAATARLGLSAQVNFRGHVAGNELAVLLNRHRIMVVPSRWNEPYPIIALDGIACGCVVVGSRGGGLKDAIGPCGLTFRNGDVEELAGVLSQLIKNPDAHERYRRSAEAHLLRHRRDEIVGAYQALFERILDGEDN